MFSDRRRVGRGSRHRTRSPNFVEAEIVVGIKAVYRAKLVGARTFELEERFTGFGVRRLVGGVLEGSVAWPSSGSLFATF